MIDGSIYRYLLPYQPWIFLGGVLLFLIVAGQSIVFVTPYRNALRDSGLWRFIRIGTASLLGLYACLASFSLVLFTVFVLMAGHGSSEQAASFAGRRLLVVAGLMCCVGLLIFWVRGSRIASVVLLLILSGSSLFLVSYRIASICEPLALMGSSRAQLCMAELSLFKSSGSRPKGYYSHHSTKDWYEMAAAGGNPHAAYLMGVRKRDEVLLRTALERGELRAAVPFAGTVSGESRSEGLHWVVQAAEHGIPDAMEYLGHLCIRGQDVEQNIAKGIEYLGKAAQAGQVGAMWFMAIEHAKGSSGLEKDAELSRKWEMRAVAREQELVELEAKLRSTYNFEIRPDLLRMKLDRLQALDTLEKARQSH